MLEYDAAIDEMFSLFNATWQAGSASIVGYVPEVRWPGNKIKTSPPSDKYWARVSQQGIDEPQTSLSNCVGSSSASRFTPYGLLFVQLFAPKSADRGMELGRLLAKLARSAYRGKKTPGGVWFRNVRINEIDDDKELWYRFNVVAEYEYDEAA